MRFNPRARVGRDDRGHAVKIGLLRVSIHAPAWGATEGQGMIKRVSAVSIHAPAWGATRGPSWPCPACAVSIHAPAWGATADVERFGKDLDSFNPRARVGRDASDQGVQARQSGFNPRARVGRDRTWQWIYRTSCEFQSTRPRGARLSRRVCCRSLVSFNPRARVGRDDIHCSTLRR